MEYEIISLAVICIEVELAQMRCDYSPQTDGLDLVQVMYPYARRLGLQCRNRLAICGATPSLALEITIHGELLLDYHHYI